MAVVELGEGLLVRLLEGLVASVPGGLGAGLVVLEAEGARPVGAVGIAATYDAAQIESGSGPLVEAAQCDELRITDPFSLARYPDVARALDDLDSRSPAAVVVLPGAWVNDGRLATTLYLQGPPDTEVLQVLGWYEPLLANALGLLEYCGQAEAQAEQLVRMVQYRRVIEQAKGMIMSRRAVGPDEAFAALVSASQASNVKLRALAVALVEAIGGGPAEHPRDPNLREHASPAARAAATALWDELATPVGERDPGSVRPGAT